MNIVSTLGISGFRALNYLPGAAPRTSLLAAMALEPSRGIAVVLLAAVCCLHGTQGTSPPYPPFPPKPPVCLNNPLIKVNFVQSAEEYSQILRYHTVIPALSSFTIHYWFRLQNTIRTHTLFNYASNSYAGSELLEVQLETTDKGKNQFWKVTIDGVETRVSNYPPIEKWQWYHALHSWDSSTGIISHYINGKLIQSHYNYQTKGLVISSGGIAQSGQTRHAINFNNGVDQGEGLNGWLTLLQLSGKPIGVPTSSDTVAAKAERAYRCEDQEEGELISWSQTPKSGYGGVTIYHTSKYICGHF